MALVLPTGQTSLPQGTAAHPRFQLVAQEPIRKSFDDVQISLEDRIKQQGVRIVRTAMVKGNQVIRRQVRAELEQQPTQNFGSFTDANRLPFDKQIEHR